jgi:hypothetical protein
VGCEDFGTTNTQFQIRVYPRKSTVSGFWLRLRPMCEISGEIRFTILARSLVGFPSG